MQVTRYLSMGWLVKLIRNPGFWLIVVLLILITIPHYEETLKHPSFLTHVMANLGLDRHAFERILYLAPIVWAGFIFGWQGAVITSMAALVCMLPRVIFLSEYSTDALFETSAVFIIGNILSLSFHALRKEREYRTRLEIAQQELKAHVQVIEKNEEQLTALNQISSTVSQSLELSQVLSSAMDSVMDLMQVEIALVFLLNEATGELSLAAHRGVSAKFVQGIGKVKLGEGLNGRVAKTGESLYVKDASQDPSLTKMAVREEGIQSQLIVPLKSKGKVVGTLSVAVRKQRQMLPEELDLVTAIGNQIGVAIENARLYQQQQEVTERLRTSEEKYRELFENAHDAIWLHDLEENIMAANRACTLLTGYTLEELYSIKASNLFTEECVEKIKSMEALLRNGEALGRISEAAIIRKNGTEAFAQLSTSPVLSNGQVTGFQHIARDVTEEKKLQENLRFYLQQVTRAQEEERKRISRELHDDTIQALVVLSRQLDTLASGNKELSADNRFRLEDLRQQTNNIMQGVRRLSQDLRPAALDRLGLLAALEWLASDITEYSGIATKVKVLGTERRLSEEVELVLFRITQEALRNVWRHSRATRAEVTVEFNEHRIIITVSDNGQGFQLPEKMGDLARDGKLGLAGMQERAQLLGANITVQSKIGKGSSVTVELPV